MTTVYLDNCCFNRPFDDQLHPLVKLETESKILIQKEIANGKLNLVWSFMLHYKNSVNPFIDRRKQVGRMQCPRKNTKQDKGSQGNNNLIKKH